MPSLGTSIWQLVQNSRRGVMLLLLHRQEGRERDTRTHVIDCDTSSQSLQKGLKVISRGRNYYDSFEIPSLHTVVSLKLLVSSRLHGGWLERLTQHSTIVDKYIEKSILPYRLVK